MPVRMLLHGFGLSWMVLQTWGQSSPGTLRSISVDDCVQAALANNRDVQIERLNPRIARNLLDSARGFYDPLFLADIRPTSIADTGGLDPTDLSREAIYRADGEEATVGLTGFLPTGMSYQIGGEYSDSYGIRNYDEFDSYNLWAGITVRQPLLRDFWIDQSRLAIQINKKNLRFTELGVRYMVMNVINLIYQAYYDLVYARENLRVQEKLLEVRQRFDAETKQQVQVGRLPSLDEKLAESQVAQVQAALVTARNTVALAENQLKTLLGDDFVSSVGVTLAPSDRLVVVPGVFDLRQSWQTALAERPDLLQMRVDLEKADLDLKYRRNQLFPSLDVVAGYGRRGSSTARPPLDPPPASLSDAFDQVWDGDAPNDLIGLIFSMPLSRARERAEYRGSKELREQVRLRIKQREELILREIDDALKTVQSNFDRVSATRKAAEYAKAAVEAELIKLGAGRSTPYIVLQLQGDMAAAESTEYLARAEYLKSVSQLYFAEGSTIERNGIVLEIQ